MSGETSDDISGFTVDTLFVHMQKQIDDLRDQLNERYATQTKAVEAAFTAQSTAMQTAFTAADKAVDKALDAAEKAVDRRQDTLDREFHEHLEQVRHENSLAFINSDKAIAAALASQEKAVSKAEIATEKQFAAVSGRFATVNEFRGQLDDTQRLFLPRSEYAANHQNLADRVTDLTDRINRTEGKGQGQWALYTAGIAALGLLVSVVIVANIVFGR